MTINDLSDGRIGNPTDTLWTTVYTADLCKNGNVVTMYAGGMTETPITVNNNDVLWKIPEQYRPKSGIGADGQLRFSSSNSPTTYRFARCRITSYGNVIFQGATAQMAYFSIYAIWGV